MPDGNGGLNAGERILRLEQRAEAIEADCTLGTERVWKEIDNMKAHKVASDAAVQAQISDLKKDQAVSTARMAIYASIGCAGLTMLCTWLMNKVSPPEVVIAPAPIVHNKP